MYSKNMIKQSSCSNARFACCTEVSVGFFVLAGEDLRLVLTLVFSDIPTMCRSPRPFPAKLGIQNVYTNLDFALQCTNFKAILKPSAGCLFGFEL